MALSPRPVLLLGVLAGVAACTALTGIDEIGICLPGECTDAASILPSDSSRPEDGASTPNTNAPKPDAPSQPICSTCDGGMCCTPNVCRTNGTCAACGSVQTRCAGDQDCCSGQKCSARGQCVDTCSGADGGCAYAPGVGSGVCCFGLTCELVSFYGRCESCTPIGAQCSDPDECCSNECTNGACVP